MLESLLQSPLIWRVREVVIGEEKNWRMSNEFHLLEIGNLEEKKKINFATFSPKFMVKF